MLRRSVFVTALIVATPLAAQDAALVIGNEDYRAGPDVSGAEDTANAADALAAAGFTLRRGANLPTTALRDLLSDHYGDTGQAGRSVILLSGNFAHHGAKTWFLGTEAKAPGLTEVDMAGLSLGTVLELAAERPGAAMVLLGTEDHRMTLGRGLIAGIGSLDVPQGVTVSGDALLNNIVIATAVPEPQIAGMMLAGLLGVGWMARRRGVR